MRDQYCATGLTERLKAALTALGPDQWLTAQQLERTAEKGQRMPTYFDLEMMVLFHQETLARAAANERLARTACSGVPSMGMRTLLRGLLGALRLLGDRRAASERLGSLAVSGPTRGPWADTFAAKQPCTYPVTSAAGDGRAAGGTDAVGRIAPREAA